MLEFRQKQPRKRRYKHRCWHTTMVPGGVPKNATYDHKVVKLRREGNFHVTKLPQKRLWRRKTIKAG